MKICCISFICVPFENNSPLIELILLICTDDRHILILKPFREPAWHHVRQAFFVERYDAGVDFVSLILQNPKSYEEQTEY